ncbi:amino acid/amide ABC transporter substrate-binding protein (HAAT family) [Hydrogenivirga caldilitoris]|uniref:Amino acid/amide ABC transporter substrate-binding protein (HAAT family) n=1 Tax=Hydrogenivirga caldilitoris TaxID=246264 RepID=A0A497XSG6_9AQUI|nr:amino acid ABC transporter substrate-binding protein [Hydrogenivirga caldilitoris]RLJ71244.1 amino acid/amide ABC transporter substrate-binding protein (HAAT family) [Hydrogenivirga caldilitoris]
MRFLLFFLTIFVSLSFSQEVLKLGAAISFSGKYAKEGELLKRGYELWKDRVNSQGGVKIGDKSYRVDIIYYDDQSDPKTTAKLVEKLITEDGVSFILGPYGSSQVFAAAGVVEKYRALMVQGGGASSKIYKQGYKHVFGVFNVAPDYGKNLIDLALSLEPKPRTVAIVYEKDIFSEDAATGALEEAKRKGLKVVLFESYPKGSQDLSSLMLKVRLSNPDVVIGAGHFKDSVLVVKQLKQFKINPKFLGLTVGPPVPAFVEALGKDAEHIFGPVQWTKAFSYRDPLFGSTRGYVEAYREKYGEDPEYHAAGGTAAALVLQLALEKAGSLEVDKVRSALLSMREETFYGVIGFDETGKIVTKPMAVIQIQNGKPVTVYPFQEAKPVYPKPEWD